MEEGEEEVEEEKEEEEKGEVEEEVEKRKEEEKKEQKEEKKGKEECKEKGKKKRKGKEEKKEEMNTCSFRREDRFHPNLAPGGGGRWNDLPASITDRRFGGLSSRDQLSVNTKIVCFWTILLAQAERAY